MALSYHSMEVLVGQLLYTMFITNNHASFHLWWRERLIKYQKVLKYYDQGCRSKIQIVGKRWEAVEIENTTRFAWRLWFLQLPIGLSCNKFTLGPIAKTYPQHSNCKRCCWFTFSDQYLGNYMFYMLLYFKAINWIHQIIFCYFKSSRLKKVFLKFSQNSQENICTKVSFLIKLQAWDLHFYQKSDSGTFVLLEILWNF